MPIPPERPAELRGRVFRGTRAVQLGVLTPAQLRSGAWRRLRRDVYADAELEVTHLLQAVGVSLVMPEAAVFGGVTAAALWGMTDVASSADDVEVLVPPGDRWTPGPGVRVRATDPGEDAVLEPRWQRPTSRVRTTLDLIRCGSLDDAVVLLDRLVAGRIVPLAEVRAAAAALPRGRGTRQAREVPVPVAQYVVRHDGRFVARVDLAWPEKRLALEYDGLWHGDPDQFQRDRRRLNALLAAGWRVLFVTAADLRQPELLLRRIAAALADDHFGSAVVSV